MAQFEIVKRVVVEADDKHYLTDSELRAELQQRQEPVGTVGTVQTDRGVITYRVVSVNDVAVRKL